MSIAIETRYIGPTNTKGGRIVATTANDHRHIIPYPHHMSGEEAHRIAAEQLCAKMNWSGRLIAGGTKRGYAFVFCDDTAA